MLKKAMVLVASALVIFVFDRIRYAVTFDRNRNFLNEAISGSGALPQGWENHFFLLEVFNNLEVALYIIMVACGMFFISRANFIRSLIFSTLICMVGTMIGRAFARTQSIRIEFFQSILIAMVTTAIIALIFQRLKKGNDEGRH